MIQQRQENAAKRQLGAPQEMGGVDIHVEGGKLPRELENQKPHPRYDELIKRGERIAQETGSSFPIYPDLEQSPGVPSKHATEKDKEWFWRKRNLFGDKGY